MKTAAIAWAVCLTALFTACLPAQQNRPNPSTVPHTPDGLNTRWQPLTDSGAAAGVLFGDSAGDWYIKWGNGQFSRTLALTAFTGSPNLRTPPQVCWQNSQFIGLMTFWSGPFSEHLFLPLDSTVTPRFFSTDIEYTDTTGNFVVALDSISEKEGKQMLWWTISSLKNSNTLKFSLPAPQNCKSYPWHGEITRKGDELHICNCGGEIVEKVAISQFMAER
ncbi:MAG: hypothetical protein MUC87_16930 [Bacteroidia bacterium]|jgi:hypothetical protein|nr:hypothetical protein [Bacteroidia bacterium]